MYFPLCIKINSKWIKTLIYNLNIEFIVENIGEIFQDLGRGRNLWVKKESGLVIVTDWALYTNENGDNRGMNCGF